ncbi:hypothetical protein FRB94_002522 [Tulasnella sp. JGI-2019a]|nr:hypothetical protein FRB94_002522 [Tulasnella sp. JGI-2019a]
MKKLSWTGGLVLKAACHTDPWFAILFNLPSTFFLCRPPPMTTTVMIMLLIGAAFYVAATKVYQSFRMRGSLRLPPGPPGDFIIGNLRDMPASYAWETFTEWGRKYGPLSYHSIAGQSILVINSQEVATDLLDKRSAIYSDRPRLVMASELSGFDIASVLLHYGPTHRIYRKLFAQALHPRVVEKDFEPLQERLSRYLVKALVDDPDNFIGHIHRSTGEVMQSITYGDSFDGETDLVEMASENVRNFGKALTGYIVDFLPWLRYLPEWFPGAQFKRDARRFRELAYTTRWLPFNMTKRQVADGTATPSFTLSLLEGYADGESEKQNDDIISAAAFTLFGAGSDTIAGTLDTFMLAMTLYPEVQAKARAELDQVVGDRLPTVTDKDSTPYLNAVIKETLRWHSVAPNGGPHRLIRDDMYQGYFIPAGTIVLVNVWGILHDERHFPIPLTFNPDRFVSNDHEATPIDPWSVAFGYGTRSCQGIAFSQSALWIAMSTILYSLEIHQKVDPETGRVIIPEARWTGDSTSFPKPFVCDIVSRSPERMEQIKIAIVEDDKVHETGAI